MLDQAVSVERGSCADSADLDRIRLRAAQMYTSADQNAQAAADARMAASDDRATAKNQKSGSDVEAATLAAARAADGQAADDDRKELEALVDGAVRDPFQPGRIKMLAAVISRLGPLNRDQADAACQQARFLAWGGLPEQASQLLAHPLSAANRAPCKQATLIGVEARTTALTRAAEAADSHGATARADYARALRADESLRTAQTYLISAAAHDRSALDNTVRGFGAFPAWLDSAWPAVLWFVVLLLAVAAVCFAAFRGISQLHYKLGSFGGGQDTTLTGDDVSALLTQALESRRTGAFPDRIPAIAKPDQTMSDIATFLGTVPSAGPIISALLKLVPSLFGPRTAVISGRLLQSDGTSAGLSLAIDIPRKPTKGRVLREREIDPTPQGTDASQQSRVIAPAAIWIREELKALAKSPSSRSDPSAVTAKMLATAGEAWAAAGDHVRAAYCYSRALDHDPDLLPAIHNLAVSEIRTGAFESAALRLRGLRVRLGSGDAGYHGLHNSVLYNLALADMYTS